MVAKAGFRRDRRRVIKRVRVGGVFIETLSCGHVQKHTASLGERAARECYECS